MLISFFRIIRITSIIATAMMLSGCGSKWGWYVVDPTLPQGWTNLTFMLNGMYSTISISVFAMSISITVGFFVSIPAFSRNKYIRGINKTYVEVVRSAPVLVLILWIHYGLPQFTGISVGIFASGLIALALSDSAFEAEVFRAGIQSVDKGQLEAARALSLSRFHTMRFIILPQAIRRIMPAFGNQFVYMIKMSSLVSIIGLQELTRRANELVTIEHRALEIYSILVLEYLVLILVVSAGVRKMERRLNRDTMPVTTSKTTQAVFVK